MKGSRIYAIIDLMADEFIGHLLTARHDAVAVRTFTDLASSRDTVIGNHIEDFELRHVATIDENNVILPANRTVLTGAAWKALNDEHSTPQPEPLNLIRENPHKIIRPTEEN